MTNREELEANDLRLVKKFREIAHRKSETKKSGTLFPMLTVCVVIMIGVLSVGAVGVIFHGRPTKEDRPIDVKVVPPPIVKGGEGNVIAANPLALPPSMAGKNNDTKQASSPASPSLAPSSHQSENVRFDEPAETVLNELTAERALSPTLPDVTELPGVSIRKIVTCRGVKNRQYMNADHEFFLKNKPKPTVWMAVEAGEPPLTLTHVYYVNGEKYCSVPLVIRYRRTRTWSRIKASTRAHLGDWRVDVVTDSGQAVGRVTFRVSP